MHLKRSFAKYFGADMHIFLRASLLFLILGICPWLGKGLYAGIWDQVARVQGLYRVLDLREGMHDERFRLLHGAKSDTLTCTELHRTFDLPAGSTPDREWFLWLYSCPVGTRILVNGLYISSVQADSFGVVIPVPAGIMQMFRNELVLQPEHPVQAGCVNEVLLLSAFGESTSELMFFPNFIIEVDTAFILDQCRDTLVVQRYLNEVKTAGVHHVFLSHPPTLSMLLFLNKNGYQVCMTPPHVWQARIRGTDSISWYDRNGNRTPAWGSWYRVLDNDVVSTRMSQVGRIWTYLCFILYGLVLVLVRFMVPGMWHRTLYWIIGGIPNLMEIKKGTLLKQLPAFTLCSTMLFLETLSLPMVWTSSAWARAADYFSWVSFPSLFSGLCTNEQDIYPHIPNAAIIICGWIGYRFFWFASFAWITGLSNRLHMFVQMELLTGFHEAIAGSFLAILMMIVPAPYVVPLLVCWSVLMFWRLGRRVVNLWLFSGEILGFRGFVRILYICVLEFLPFIILF